MILRHRLFISQFQQYRYYATIAQIESGCNNLVVLKWRFWVRLCQQMFYKYKYNILETIVLWSCILSSERGICVASVAQENEFC